MTTGAYKIAMGVIVTAMGVAILPTVGPLAFAQILAGGLLVYMGVRKAQEETKRREWEKQE